MEEYVDWDAMLAELSDASSASSRAGSPVQRDVAYDCDTSYASSSPERDLCRDYTCCGLRLADLHALVCHFEEAHVVTDGGEADPAPPVTSAFGTFVVRGARASDADSHGRAPYPKRRPDEAPVCLSLRELVRPVDGDKELPPRKKYVCPRQGCIKSYRNASGLDYHLRKGTCKVV